MRGITSSYACCILTRVHRFTLKTARNQALVKTNRNSHQKYISPIPISFKMSSSNYNWLGINGPSAGQCWAYPSWVATITSERFRRLREASSSSHKESTHKIQRSPSDRSINSGYHHNRSCWLAFCVLVCLVFLKWQMNRDKQNIKRNTFSVVFCPIIP